MGGSMNHTTRKATNTAAADTRLVRWAALRNASKAVARAAAAAGAGSPCDVACSSTCTVAMTELDIASLAACGNWAGNASRVGCRLLAYRVARTVPMTATPSAPPSCRTVFCTADPAPARASGSTFCITVDAGAITLPIPKPKKKKTVRISQSGVSRCSKNASATCASVTTSRPPAIT